MARRLASSRRSDSRSREKISTKKKKRGETRRPPRPPPRFPGVQFNSLSPDRRAPLSEDLNAWNLEPGGD